MANNFFMTNDCFMSSHSWLIQIQYTRLLGCVLITHPQNLHMLPGFESQKQNLLLFIKK